jgi:hypothetical protein
MKKLLILAIAATLCFAVAMPASAKVSVGGMVSIGYSFYDQNDANQAGGYVNGTTLDVNGNPTSATDGTQQTIFSLIRPLNQITVRYASDDNNLRGFIQIRGGAEGAAVTPGLGDPFTWNYSWIDWQISPNFYLRFGRQTQTAFANAPGNTTGTGWTRQDNNGYRSPHGFSAKDGIRAFIKFNDMVRMEIAAYNADDDNGENLAGDEQSIWPRFDLSVPISVAGWKIEPYGMWLTQEYDNVLTGTADKMDVWGFGLNVRGGFGPVVFSGAAAWGQNWGAGNVSIGSPANHIPQARQGTSYDADGDGINEGFADADQWGWFAEAGVKFGPGRVMIVYGQLNMENDQSPNTTADDVEQDLAFYGIYAPISIAKGFTIMPELMWYDQDGDAKNGANNPNTIDRGDEFVLGVRFDLKF